MRNGETSPSVKYTATPPQRGINGGQAVHRPTKKQEAYAKSLRQQVMITSKSLHNWSNDEFHEMLKSWGFGSSLRKLTIQQLQAVLGIVKGEYIPDSCNELQRQLDKYSIGFLDAQGRYAWHLMKVIGWDWFRVQKYMIKKYHTLHWNVLEEEEKRGMIAMLKYYQEKGNDNLPTNYTNYTKNKEGENNESRTS
jgi:hypothetical protein